MLPVGNVGTVEVENGKVFLVVAYAHEDKAKVKLELEIGAADLIRELVKKTPNVFDDALAEMVIKALDAAV